MTRPKEFDARVMAYVPGMENMARKLVRTREQRGDLVTDTIIKALKRWDTFREEGGMWRWLTFLMRDVARSARESRPQPMEELDETDHPSAFASPEDGAHMTSVLARLHEMRHATTVLRVAAGHSLQEVADEDGVTHQAIADRLKYTRARLRKVAG
jgi:RNA polymerase sigma factor (sigma-70 family)